MIGTGAVPVRPPLEGLDLDGVHVLHSMDDTFAIMRTIEERSPKSAVIVGGGYIGLEMAEGLTSRGIAVTQMEQLPEVLPTVDPELGALVHAELAAHGVHVRTGTAVEAITPGKSGRLEVHADGNAIFHDMTVDELSELDLSHTPPFGSPWDALQTGAQAWVRAGHANLVEAT